MKPKNIPRRLGGVFIFGLFVFGLSFFHSCQSASKKAEESVDLSAVQVFDLPQGPVALYDNACARCHGVNGAQYGQHFYTLDYNALFDENVEMMNGPGQMNGSPADQAAMTDYHVAIQNKVPFVSVNNAEDVLTGTADVITGDHNYCEQVFVEKDGMTYTATIKPFTWSLENPPAPPFTVTAVQNGTQSVLLFPKEQWSFSKINEVKADE